MRRILLISFTGQVGAELWRTLQPLGHVVPVDRHPDKQYAIDLTQPDSIRRILDEVKPDLIVNAAAYTAVDKAEQEADVARLVNADAVAMLAAEAKVRDILLVHYSTDYVYNGNTDSPYLESAAPDPQSIYGRTKLAGDQAIVDSGCQHLIFRTSWVYGTRGQNFLLTMQRLAKERDTLRVVADQYGAPTWSRLIAEATAQALSQVYNPRLGLDMNEISGIYHLTNAGMTNWCDFAKAIVKHEPNPPVVLPIKSEEYIAPAKRPAYSVLSNDKLADVFGLRLPDWEHSLALCLAAQHNR
jgi:dTDP-4-dehydrorhamnose reductase